MIHDARVLAYPYQQLQTPAAGWSWAPDSTVHLRCLLHCALAHAVSVAWFSIQKKKAGAGIYRTFRRFTSFYATSFYARATLRAV